MSSSSLVVSLALRYINDAHKIVARTIEQLTDPILQEHVIELTVAQNHITTVADHIKTIKNHISDLEKRDTLPATTSWTPRPSTHPLPNGSTLVTMRDSFSPTLNSPNWSPVWPSVSHDRGDNVRGLNDKISALEQQLRETIQDKDALISVKMEELAHLQERLDGRDTLLSRREAELDDLRAKMQEESVKQESSDGLEHRAHDDKRYHESVEESGDPHTRSNRASNDLIMIPRAPPQQRLPAKEPQARSPFVPHEFLRSNHPPNVVVHGNEFTTVLSTDRNIIVPRDIGSLTYDGVWRQYHDEIIWSYSNARYDRCLVLAPNIVYSRDKQRYEKENRHHRLGQIKDLFWRREIKGMREWFYLGRYKCLAVNDMKLEDARFVNRQAPKALARRVNEECTIIKNLYEIDALQCRCIALERVGFSLELQTAILRHYDNVNSKRRKSCEREARDDRKRRRY